MKYCYKKKFSFKTYNKKRLELHYYGTSNATRLADIYKSVQKKKEAMKLCLKMNGIWGLDRVLIKL
jgi:hypothetical protein